MTVEEIYDLHKSKLLRIEDETDIVIASEAHTKVTIKAMIDELEYTLAAHELNKFSNAKMHNRVNRLKQQLKELE